MNESAIEKELRGWLVSFRFELSGHDRGVLLGLVLSCVPMQPMCGLGLLISLWNLKLWRNRKLELHEGKLIHVAVICALITNVVSTWVIYKAASTLPVIGGNYYSFLLCVVDAYKGFVLDVTHTIGNFMSEISSKFHGGLHKQTGDFI